MWKLRIVQKFTLVDQLKFNNASTRPRTARREPDEHEGFFRSCWAASCVAFLPTIGDASPLAFESKLNITGYNDLNFANQTITFQATDAFNIIGETGSFMVLGTGGSITLTNQGTPINWNNLNSNLNLGCGLGCLYVGSNNGVTVSFNLLTETVKQDGIFLDIAGTGIITLTGFDPTPGIFYLSSQGGSATHLSFSTTTIAVPGPVVGAGIPGLLFGFGGLLAWRGRWRRWASRVRRSALTPG